MGNLERMSAARGKRLSIGVCGCRICGVRIPDKHERGWLCWNAFYEEIAESFLCHRCWLPYEDSRSRKRGNWFPQLKTARARKRWLIADFNEWLAVRLLVAEQREERRA